MKKTLLLIFCFFYVFSCFGQQTIEKRSRLNDNVTEIFQADKNDQEIRDGPYQAVYKRRTPVAMGNYSKGKKVGLWRFYNDKSRLMQVFNYDTDSLKYEAREYTSTSDLWYAIDKVIHDTDKVTKPLKIGGRYFGYLPYLGLFKVPFSPQEYTTSGCVAVVELLISPLGRLAEYKVHAVCGLIQYDQTVTMDVHLFKEEDKTFIPATYNGEAVLSRIMIRCRVNAGGGLDFL